jgi:hypothetical protein
LEFNVNIKPAPACWAYPLNWAFFNAHTDAFVDEGPDAACAYFMGCEL